MRQNYNTARKRFEERNGKGPWRCYFCGKMVAGRGRGTLSLAVHHVDEDYTNTSPENEVPSHIGCHTSHHWQPHEPVRGEAVGTSKLTEIEVSRIRHLYQSDFTQDELAEMFGVAQGTISKIVRREHWRHSGTE